MEDDNTNDSNVIILEANDNMSILYITFFIIMAVFVIWIFITIFTKEDPVKILNEMMNLSSQIKPVSDEL